MWYASWKTPILALLVEDSILGRGDPLGEALAEGVRHAWTSERLQPTRLFCCHSPTFESCCENGVYGCCTREITPAHGRRPNAKAKCEGPGAWKALPVGNKTAYCSDRILTLESTVVFNSFHCIGLMRSGFNYRRCFVCGCFPPTS